MSFSTEQARHDKINLRRLVKRLEEIVSSEAWMDGDNIDDDETLVKVNVMNQRLLYARQLLRNVDATFGTTSSITQKKQLDATRDTLDRLEIIVNRAKQKLADHIIPPETSYLSLVPLPEEDVSPSKSSEETQETNLIPARQAHSPTDGSPEADLLPPPQPTSASKPLSSRMNTSSVLSASVQTHEELSAELAHMAEQLKRNAQYFSESLERDRAVVQTAAEVLDKNYEGLSKEQVRLKTHSGKSFWTSWITIAAVLVVCLTWVVMFIIIRLT